MRQSWMLVLTLAGWFHACAVAPVLAPEEFRARVQAALQATLQVEAPGVVVEPHGSHSLVVTLPSGVKVTASLLNAEATPRPRAKGRHRPTSPDQPTPGSQRPKLACWRTHPPRWRQ